MARIRSIKPDFFRHEGLYEAERKAKLPLRLAFAGLWTAADREGRFRWSPRTLKLDCLPYDDGIDFGAVLDALASAGFIHKYQVDGEFYGFIPSWQDHQVINQREAQSKLPEPSDASMCMHSTEQVQTCGEGKGKEGERKGKGKGKEETREVALSSDPLGFHLFWDIWPNKVGKPAALKALKSALKRVDDISEILDGARNYIRDKPPDRPWLNPATFLNQDRWKDQPAPNASARPTTVHQQRQAEGKAVLDELHEFNTRPGGREDSRVLRQHPGDGAESIRGGVGGNLIELSPGRDRSRG